MDLWSLPTQATLGGKPYPHRWDYRTALDILAILNDRSPPIPVRWYRALARFYEEPISYGIHREAMAYLARFLTMDQPETVQEPLVDWQADAPEILEGINAVAGRDIRRDPDIHWWTFLGWYHSIGDGRLANLVAIRSKRLRGEKLTAGEQEFIRRNPHKFRPRETDSDRQTKARLEALLRQQ